MASIELTKDGYDSLLALNVDAWISKYYEKSETWDDVAPVYTSAMAVKNGMCDVVCDVSHHTMIQFHYTQSHNESQSHNEYTITQSIHNQLMNTQSHNEYTIT